MNLPEYLKNSLDRAIAESGNMRKLAERSGVNYATINRFNSGEQAIENMPLNTLMRLFPELQIFCFNSDFIKSKQPVGDVDLEDQMLAIFRGLPHEKQVKCLVMIAANFGGKV